MSTPSNLITTTPRFTLPYLFAGQAQKEFTVNEALARIDTLLHPQIVEELAGPPESPAPGSCYLVAPGATGVFGGRDGHIASWDGTQWSFVTPTAGMILFDASASQLLRYEAGWQRLSAPVLPSGGTTIDSEARQALEELVSLLRNFGIFS